MNFVEPRVDCPDHFAEISEAKDDFSNSIAPEKFELMIDEWTACQLNQSFWNLLGMRPQTGRKSTGER